MRTTGNTIFVDGITVIVHRKFYAERNKCFFKSNFTEKRFADFNRVKSSITKKSLRGDKGMLLKEINQDRKQVFNARGIEDGHSRQMRIKFLTYRFGHINHVIEHNISRD